MCAIKSYLVAGLLNFASERVLQIFSIKIVISYFYNSFFEQSFYKQ